METKQAFSNICERIWKQILSEEELEPEIEASMRRVVAQLVMIAWNTCITAESVSEAKNHVVAFAKKIYGECDNAATPLLNAVSIKWHDYKDDNTFIANTAVEIIDGQPRAIAYLKGELPEVNEATSAFRDFMELPEIQERLKHVPPGKLNEEIERIIGEYNASIPPVPPRRNTGYPFPPEPRRHSRKFSREKKHFAKLCGIIWNTVLEKMEFDAEQETDVRELVMQLVASAWNAYAVTGNIVDALELVRKYNQDLNDEEVVFLKILEESVKKRVILFTDDLLFPIVDTAIEVVDGKPMAIAYFEGEKRGTPPDSGKKGKGNKRKRKC